jgi:hypothetical protein
MSDSLTDQSTVAEDNTALQLARIWQEFLGARSIGITSIWVVTDSRGLSVEEDQHETAASEHQKARSMSAHSVAFSWITARRHSIATGQCDMAPFRTPVSPRIRPRIGDLPGTSEK